MSTKVVTGKVRFSYLNVFQARLNDLSGKTEFSTQVLVPKSDKATVEAIKTALNEVIKAKFGGKKPAGLKNPLKDGDAVPLEGTKALGPEYAGHYYFSCKCSEDKPPQVVDQEGQAILSSKDFVSGDYGRISVTAFGYDVKVNKGISFWLNNVQKLEDGDGLGGGQSSAAADFGTPIAKAKPTKAALLDDADESSDSDDESWA